MPFRKIKLKDPETNEYILDDNGNPIYEDERFLAHFIADTPEDAERLAVEYKKTIELLASNYARYTGIDEIEEDLIQEGLIGLARATRDWEEGRSENFRTFAIYKIKDAMKEFTSNQSKSIRIPQYIKDASSLASKLQKVMGLAGLLKETDYVSVWEQSASCDENSDVIRDITFLRKSLNNLADRSCTTVEQLLERVELYPANMADMDEIQNIGDISKMTTESVEEDIIAVLLAHKSVEKLKTILTEDEYELLYSHYVDGKTVRDLAPELDISAATVTIRIKNIRERLQSKKEKILMI